MSLPLADQKLGSHSNADSTSHKFMLKGRQSGGMHRGHAWVFRAESYETMLAWFSDIKNLTEKTGAERNEFIRRSHARSVSAGSHKAGSISSDGGMDEDEADEVPYSATASQAEISHQAEKLQQRPNPGGRFPSALKIDRDSQVPVSSSSPSSSVGDREMIGVSSGSGVPLAGSKQQVQGGDDETDVVRGDLDGASGALVTATSLASLGTSSQSPKDLPLRGQLDSSTVMLSKHAHDIGSLGDPGPAASRQGLVEATPQSLPFNTNSRDSKYGNWLAGAGDKAVGAAGTEVSQHEVKRKGLTSQEDQPGLQIVSAAQQASDPRSWESRRSPVPGAISAASPSTNSNTHDSPNQSTLPVTDVASSPAFESAPPIENAMSRRPSLGSRVATISDLHVPGEFPKGTPSMKLL